MPETSHHEVDTMERCPQNNQIEEQTQYFISSQNNNDSQIQLSNKPEAPNRITLPTSAPKERIDLIAARRKALYKPKERMRNFTSSLDINETTLLKDLLHYNHSYTNEEDVNREKELLEAKKTAIAQRKELDKARQDRHKRALLFRRNGIYRTNEPVPEEVLTDQDDSFLEALEFGNESTSQVDATDSVNIDDLFDASEEDREVVVIENMMGANPLPLSASSSNFALRPRSKKWSKDETKKLFFFIERFGFDFDLISFEFGDRTASEISKKFNVEMKRNPMQITECYNNFLNNAQSSERYATTLEHIKENRDPEIELYKKKRRIEREKEMALLVASLKNETSEEDLEYFEDPENQEVDHLSISALSNIQEQESEFTISTREPSPELIDDFDEDFNDAFDPDNFY